MITNSKQSWEIGQQVNVGFLKGLTVLAKVQTPGDFAPDAYILTREAKYYSFVPHNGLTAITRAEVTCMIEEDTRLQDRQAVAAKDKAASWEAEFAFARSIIEARQGASA